ncbi:hypothetical protein [Rubrivivax rivuli]|uniref:hypothetical protein n=1 Tax=Rubrivivax rivuli TaxID=1862385 RepID=UPI0013E2CFB4|nr:hypothetical protein [Rubrivivax rivuli]
MPEDVPRFWFEEIQPAPGWRRPEGRLAEAIVLDPVSPWRPRGTPRARLQQPGSSL